jgi:hypothetical protein
VRFGSSDRSNDFADGELSSRLAASSERTSESRWKPPAAAKPGSCASSFLNSCRRLWNRAVVSSFAGRT